MESFNERLQKLMKSAGLTDANMAYLLGISDQRMENLLTGYSEADISIVMRAAQIFNVSCAYVLGVEEDKKVAEGAKEILVAEKLDPISGMMMLNDVVKTIYIDQANIHGKDYIGLIMNDDGMVKARIYKGDTVVVCCQQFANNGDVVAVLGENGNYIIRRYNRTGNIVVLTSEGDAMKYPPIKIDTSETKLKIIGRVAESRITF